MLCLLRIAWGMVGSGSVHITEAAVELPGLPSLLCHSHRPSRLEFACTIIYYCLCSLLLYRGRCKLIWLWSHGLFSNLSFRRALCPSLYLLLLFSILILIHSALALPARSFRSVVHHPVARSLATPPCSSLSGHARFLFYLPSIIVHVSPRLYFFSSLSSSLSLFLLIQHHFYPIIFLSRAILLGVLALPKLMYLV